jgi:hypothetical protein
MRHQYKQILGYNCDYRLDHGMCLCLVPAYSLFNAFITIKHVGQRGIVV